jgi:hypothetical protein
LICFSVVTVWYALHGHAPDDVTGHRARARWYTTKTEPSYDDMAVKLRLVIIAARSFAAGGPACPLMALRLIYQMFANSSAGSCCTPDPTPPRRSRS